MISENRADIYLLVFQNSYNLIALLLFNFTIKGNPTLLTQE
jgi:hypothetical protein